MCNQVIDVGPKYDAAYRSTYIAEKSKCTRRRRLRGGRGGRPSRPQESCEDKAIKLAKEEVNTLYTAHKKKLEDNQSNEGGLARCMELVGNEYDNPLMGKYDKYEVLAYGKGNGEYGFLEYMHPIWPAFQVPRDVDSKYLKYVDMVGAQSPDGNDYDIYEDGIWIEEEDRDEPWGKKVILEGGPDRNGNDQDVTEKTWVSEDDWKNQIFKPVSPCSSGMFHFDLDTDLPARTIEIDGKTHETFPATKSAPFCGCCVGPGSESHYIFPTPLDLADRTKSGTSGNGDDQKIYLTRKSYSNSGSCGDDLGVSTVSEGTNLRQFTAEERSFTHFSYHTYETLCRAPGLNHYGCVKAYGCEPMLNQSTGKAYTQEEWRTIKEDESFCQPKNWSLDEAKKYGFDCTSSGCNFDGYKDEDSQQYVAYQKEMGNLAMDFTYTQRTGSVRGDNGLECGDLRSDDMCLGLACVWHISSEQCTGTSAFRDPECTRNGKCGSTGGFSSGR